MDLDEVRQSYSSTQNPLSDAYLEGGPTKKRRVKKNVTTSKKKFYFVNSLIR